MNAPSRLLSIKDAAAYLGLTVHQVRGLVWSGALPAVRLPWSGRGYKIYLDRKDLEALPDRLKHR